MPLIELNHIYTVLSRPTYEAIKNSPFIKDFAHTYEQKNSADGQMGWEGFYLRGKHTFIELFYPQERYKTEGITGIGLGFDTHGNLKDCFKTFQKAFPNVKYESFKRNGAAWFDYVAVNGSYYGNGHSLWIMEYAPEYFKENSAVVSREHYNAATYDPSLLMTDITSFSIALKREDQKTLASYLIQSGMTALNPHAFTNHAGIQIEICDESATQKGIFKIDFSLNKASASPQVVQLGETKIEIKGNQATWHFKSS